MNVWLYLGDNTAFPLKLETTEGATIDDIVNSLRKLLADAQALSFYLLDGSYIVLGREQTNNVYFIVSSN